jgi:hypothetical protein
MQAAGTRSVRANSKNTLSRPEPRNEGLALPLQAVALIEGRKKRSLEHDSRRLQGWPLDFRAVVYQFGLKRLNKPKQILATSLKKIPPEIFPPCSVLLSDNVLLLNPLEPFGDRIGQSLCCSYRQSCVALRLLAHENRKVLGDNPVQDTADVDSTGGRYAVNDCIGGERHFEGDGLDLPSPRFLAHRDTLPSRQKRLISDT